MKVKYNRTSTLQQEGERFKLDKEGYDLTILIREYRVRYHSPKEKVVGNSPI